MKFSDKNTKASCDNNDDDTVFYTMGGKKTHPSTFSAIVILRVMDLKNKNRKGIKNVNALMPSDTASQNLRHPQPTLS